jgi:hypothetical protein
MNVLNSLEPVLEEPNHVGIDRSKIKDFVSKFERDRLDHWLTVSPFDLTQLSEEESVAFLFVLNSISFSYWGEPKWQIQYGGETYDGAQAMMACLGRAIEDGKPILDPKYIARVNREELEQILEGNIEIPLLDERLRFLREVGAVIEKEFKGDFRYVVDRGNALDFVDALTKYFPSFRDVAEYRGHNVNFSKRAQLLSADLSHSLKFVEEDKLTACADYKLPQVLRRDGILVYSAELERKIREREIIPAGSEEEVEIRAHTIHAVELIKGEITGVTSNQVNDYLWLEGQVKLPTDEPYHLTRTTAY